MSLLVLAIVICLLFVIYYFIGKIPFKDPATKQLVVTIFIVLVIFFLVYLILSLVGGLNGSIRIG